MCNKDQITPGIVEDNHFLLRGKIRKFTIHSNSICFGPCPEPDDEVEQHLTITRDGRVFFTSYIYGDGGEHFKLNEKRQFKISQDKADHIMDVFEQHFSKEFGWDFATDCGEWSMVIVNDAGGIFSFQGSLCGAVLEETVDLSDLIRDELDMQNLYVFDGNSDDNEIL